MALGIAASNVGRIWVDMTAQDERLCFRVPTLDHGAPLGAALGREGWFRGSRELEVGLQLSGEGGRLIGMRKAGNGFNKFSVPKRVEIFP